MKHLLNYKAYILILLVSFEHTDQPFLLAAQDGLVLGVQTTINTSSQETDSSVNTENISTKDENMIKEIHSSFEDFLGSQKESSKSNNDGHLKPTLQFQHNDANIVKELLESRQAAVAYTQVESATSELHKHVPVISPSENRTGSVTISLTLSDTISTNNDTQYIVHAKPRLETQPPPSKQVDEVAVNEMAEENNGTLPVVQSLPDPPPQEDIPSFSEWAQKRLAEVEKKKGDNITGGSSIPTSLIKVRHSKNYASPDCGAKVLGANPEAISAGSVLSSSRDEYLLNTCNARIWFIVELCEAIQPKKIEMANFELFSSSPREFSVSLSDRYPTRDWVMAGHFTAQDERNVQAFNLSHTSHFGKYVKVEVHSHYGQEHYCPVSLFRVYGTSEIEVLETVDEGHHQSPDEDDDDDLLMGEGEEPKNLFGSARDAVLSIVKKAAEVLAKGPEEECRGNISSLSTNHKTEMDEQCVTPSHIVVCINCSEDFYNKMYRLLSCRYHLLYQLVDSFFVRHTVITSEFCAERGLDLRTGAPYPSRPTVKPRPIEYLQAFLPSETLTALCNLLAVVQKKVVMNTSCEHASIDNGTILQSSSLDELTPITSDSASLCTADSNMSQETPKLATKPPYEPPQIPPLPISPSRTLPEKKMAEHATDLLHIENNITLHQPEISTNNENTTNPDVPVEKSLAVDNVSLIEDSGSLDSLFSELEQAVIPSPRVPPVPHKESVFVRLANRIKALERNMSLSGQYLEELSRRYKRQVEEMQRALAGAVEDRRRGEEREGLRLEQMTQLSQQVAALTLAVKNLLEERDSWHHKATVMGQHGVIVVVEVIVFAIVLYVCRWLPDVEVSHRKFSVAWPSAIKVTRRKSVDDLPHAFTHDKSMRRRPSEEALIIAGNTHQELLIPEYRRKISKGETRRQRRKRKRELIIQSEDSKSDKSSLLDRNSSESVAAWWEELPPPPPPLGDVVITAAPRFMQTAVAQRQDRIARSSGELSEKGSKTFLKKTGPFKKIVKKFF